MMLLCVFVVLTTVAFGIQQEGSVTSPSRQPVPRPQIPQPVPRPQIPQPVPRPQIPQPVPRPQIPQPVPRPQIPQPVPRPQIPQPLQQLLKPANTTTEFQNSSGTLRRSESPQIRRMYIYKPFPIPQIRPPNVKYKVPATHSGTMPNNINAVAKNVITERSRQYNQVPKPLVMARGPLPGKLAAPHDINVDQSNVTSHGRHMTNLRSTITSPGYPEPTLHKETKEKHYTKYELMQKQLMEMLKGILNPLKSMISRSHQSSGQQPANQRQLVKDARALSNLLAKLKQGDQSLLMRRLRITPPNTNQHRQPDIRAQKQRQKRLAQQRQQRLAQRRQQRLAQRRQQRLEEQRQQQRLKEQRQRLAQQRQRQQWRQQKQRQPWQGWQQQHLQQRQFWQRQRQRQQLQRQRQRQRQPNQRLHQRYQVLQKQTQQQYHQNHLRIDQPKQRQHQQQHQQHNIVSRSLTLDHEGNSKKYDQSKSPQVFDQFRSWILAYTEHRSRQLLKQIHGTDEPTSSSTRSNINQFSKIFGLDTIHSLST